MGHSPKVRTRIMSLCRTGASACAHRFPIFVGTFSGLNALYSSTFFQCCFRCFNGGHATKECQIHVWNFWVFVDFCINHNIFWTQMHPQRNSFSLPFQVSIPFLVWKQECLKFVVFCQLASWRSPSMFSMKVLHQLAFVTFFQQSRSVHLAKFHCIRELPPFLVRFLSCVLPPNYFSISFCSQECVDFNTFTERLWILSSAVSNSSSVSLCAPSGGNVSANNSQFVSSMLFVMRF